ncbi:MAG: hypothetical protein QG629_415 [Patescibacteria group bacterium]|nr:hypothetical protein [Candidatus Saccharibacteria bacterium]MDQ5963333.1 hypothetical protein [Patescibacteria group bacterium]
MAETTRALDNLFVPIHQIQEQAAAQVTAEKYRLFDMICDQTATAPDQREDMTRLYSQIQHDPAIVARALKLFEVVT